MSVVGECILWPHQVNDDGYGVYKTTVHRDRLAHRVAYERVHGPIPRGMLVMHACDNRRCINVEHLSLGSIWANNQDKIAKGRARYELHPENLINDPVTQRRRAFLGAKARWGNKQSS